MGSFLMESILFGSRIGRRRQSRLIDGHIEASLPR
jgi:hypothetical protein